MHGRDGEDSPILASNCGSDRPPLWYLNLQANPEVELRVKSERFGAVAATRPAEEKARARPGPVEPFPRYGQYRAGTGRGIPVVRLTRS